MKSKRVVTPLFFFGIYLLRKYFMYLQGVWSDGRYGDKNMRGVVQTNFDFKDERPQ